MDELSDLRDGFYWATVDGIREVAMLSSGAWMAVGVDCLNSDLNVEDVNPKRIIE